MAVLSWGRPSKFQTTPVTDGAPAADAKWVDLEIPKDGTLKITPTAGTETTAVEEGGGLVDVRFNKYNYELEFTEFVKRGKKSAFEDTDGLVEGEHAFRFLPEDDRCEGRLIERSIVRVEETFATADGILRTIKARAIKPTSGNTVKPYAKEDAVKVVNEVNPDYDE